MRRHHQSGLRVDVGIDPIIIVVAIRTDESVGLIWSAVTAAAAIIVDVEVEWTELGIVQQSLHVIDAHEADRVGAVVRTHGVLQSKIIELGSIN